MLNDELLQDEQDENLADVPMADVPMTSMPVWQRWLPAPAQLRCALALDLKGAIDGDQSVDGVAAELPATSMRQGLGLVFLAGLLAGLIPFLFDLLLAIPAGTTVFFAQMAEQMSSLSSDLVDAYGSIAAVADTAGTIAGLEPIGPGWLAATLSALGAWIDWPLRWLTSWMVYGIGVLIIAKLLGAPSTLQRFYAGISYAYVPLLLLGLAPIPYVGWAFVLAGLIWAVIVYVRAVRVVTEFDTLRSLVSVFSPFILAAVIAAVVATATAVSVLRLFLF